MKPLVALLGLCLTAAVHAQEIQVTKLLGSDLQAHDGFGSDVAFSGNGEAVVVGVSPDPLTRVGGVYVFEREGEAWTERAILRVPGRFTASRVAVDENATRIAFSILGEPIDTSPLSVFAVCVFAWNGDTWVEEARLLAPEPNPYDYYGTAIAMSADGATLLVGQPYHRGSDGFEEGGFVYVYNRTGTTWTQAAALRAEDWTDGDHFGQSVALSADGATALIGAPGDFNTLGDDVGAAYVFTAAGGTWHQQARLLDPRFAPSDGVGIDVALDAAGDVALVTAFGHDAAGLDAGGAFVFTRTGDAWAPQALLTAAAPAIQDRLGQSAALDAAGQRAILGSVHNEAGGEGAGAALVYERDGEAWHQQHTFTGGTNALLGYSVALSPDGRRAAVGAPFDSEVALFAGVVYFYEAASSTAVGGETDDLDLVLDAPAPNPFGATTTLRYTLARATPVRLSVYDGLGREVAVLASGLRPAGVHEVVLDGSMLPRGVYVVRLTAGEEVRTTRATALR